MLQKWKVMLARFPYGGTERTELVDWCASAALWAAKQPDIDGGMKFWHVNDTPITMGRNLAVKVAINTGADILVMVDSDMAPDIDKSHPFLPHAFEFIKSRWHKSPTIISAPYCTSGPAHAPIMGRWRTEHDGFKIATSLYTREEAAELSGIQECSLQGTGLMAIDMRVFTGFDLDGETIKLPPPWFYYEYTDEYNTTKGSTEDMVFTRNVSLLFAKYGLTVGYVDWDAWATHVKTEFIGKPFTVDILTVAPLHKEFKE